MKLHRIHCLFVIAGALALPVSAAPADCETLQSVEYSPKQVTKVKAKRGFVTQIIMGPGETIIDKRGGDSDGWEVASVPGTGILTIKPRSTAHPSNLIVTTDRRAYVMALSVLPDNSRCDGTWQIVYKIPQPPVIAVIKETPEMIAKKQADAAKEALKEKLPVSNMNYSMEQLPGSGDIVPNEVYDDGRFTYMRFSGNRELPSIFKVAADGTEVMIDKHMEDRDLVVLHEVGRQWVLRLDKQTIGIWNDSFNLDGVPPIAGTVSSKVQRITNGMEYGDE